MHDWHHPAPLGWKGALSSAKGPAVCMTNVVCGMLDTVLGVIKESTAMMLLVLLWPRQAARSPIGGVQISLHLIKHVQDRVRNEIRNVLSYV